MGGAVFVVLYMVALIIIGFWTQKSVKKDDLRDYYIASGQVSTIHAFMTSLATGFSAFTFLGAVGLAYGLGLDGIILGGGAIILTTPFVMLIGKRIWALGKKYGYITPSDLLADRFDDSKTIQVIVAAIVLVFSFFYINIQLVGLGYIIDVLTGGVVPYVWAIIIGAVLIAFYVTIGGLRAVIYSDFLQAILLTLGLFVISIYAYTYALDGAILEAARIQPNVYQLQFSPLYLYTVCVGYGMSVCVWPQFYTRYFAVKKISGVFQVGVGNDVGSILLLTIFAATIGFTGITLFTDVAPDSISIRFITIMPVFLAWPMAAAAAAAAKSTADSILLMLGSVYTRDIHPFIQPKATSKQLNLVSRIAPIIITLLAVLAALQPPEFLLRVVLDLSYPGFLLLLPITLAAIYWRRATKEGVIAALVVGLVTLVCTIFIWPEALNIYPGVWGFVTSSLTLIIVSLITPQPSEEKVNKFHNYLDEVDYKALEEE